MSSASELADRQRRRWGDLRGRTHLVEIDQRRRLRAREPLGFRTEQEQLFSQ